MRGVNSDSSLREPTTRVIERPDTHKIRELSGFRIKVEDNASSSATCLNFGDTAILKIAFQKGATSTLGQSTDSTSIVIIFVVAGAIIRLGEPQEFTTPALADTTWFYDESTETTVEFIDDSQIIAVRLPAQVLSEFGISDSAQLLQLRYDDGLVGPTRAFLESTLNLDSQLPSVSRYFLEKLVHEMVGGIILENMGVSKSGTTRRSLFEQSIAYIAATTGDPELTPLKLATELSVSLRQLQREFKRQGLTIASSIKQNRIDLAVRLLQDPKFMVLSIEKIAEHSGFTSLVQLRRALQAAGLGNPTDLRVSSGQQTI
ncbi:hypothetical protein CQ018_17325 [Arthrobacter sp. MYb227]|nr:hypothetical protein CQ018_17325 [Arthrobacter sp. MYb227]